jgi:hypothetical protein
LKKQAAQVNVVGYYAGRMLCDVLPIKATLDNITPAVAVRELEEARKLDQGTHFSSTLIWQELFLSVP